MLKDKIKESYIKVKGKEGLWRRDYVFISRLNIFFLFFFLITGIILFSLSFSFWANNEEAFSIALSIGIGCLFYSYCLYFFSKYLFIHDLGHFKNKIILEAIKNFGVFYNRRFTLKYLATIFYQAFMVISLFYVVLSPIWTSSGVGSINWTSFGILLAYYLSWFLISFLDYLNAYSEEFITTKVKSFRYVKATTGFFVFALFWVFMPNPKFYWKEEKK